MFFLRISCTSSSSRSHACITLAFPKLLHCTVHYTEIHVNYNRTIQRGITLLHHKAVFTNPCYYATLATMPLSLGPKGWHSIEVWLYSVWLRTIANLDIATLWHHKRLISQNFLYTLGNCLLFSTAATRKQQQPGLTVLFLQTLFH